MNGSPQAAALEAAAGATGRRPLAASAPLRVAHFTNALVRGGAEQHILGLLRQLDPQRFQQWLVCPAELAAQLAPDLPASAGLHPCRLRQPRHAATAWRLAAWLRREGINILHCHLFYSSLFATPVARLAGVPVVVETPHLREHWRHGWKAHYFLDRCVGRGVSAYIAVSAANAQYLRQVKRLPAAKIHTIPNGVNLEAFTPLGPGPAAAARAGLGLSPADILLVVPARLEVQKGHAVLLRALGRIRQRFPSAHAAFAGAGSQREALAAQAAQLGLGPAVHFLGFQAEIAPWLAAADIVVLPSWFEGMPLAAIEALAAARPIVATAVDGTVEVITDGRTGLLVPPGDAAALAQAIGRLLADPALASRLAAAGGQAARRFDLRRQAAATGELYLELWRRSHPNAPPASTARQASRLAGPLVAAQPPYSGRSRWSLRLGFDRQQRSPAGARGVSKLPRVGQHARLASQRPLPLSSAPSHPHAADPDAIVRNLLTSACDEFCRQHAPAPWRALILTGSVARGENTWRPCARGWRLDGDIDLLAIAHRRGPARRLHSALGHHLQAALHAAGLQAELSLGGGGPGYLRRLAPSVFSYELISVGEVLWGERHILSLVPGCRPGAIGREDAWRLLNNRIAECLAAVAEGGDAVPMALDKLYLAMADSWLLFLGRYELGAQARLGQMEAALTAQPHTSPWAQPDQILAAVRRVRSPQLEKTEPATVGPAPHSAFASRDLPGPVAVRQAADAAAALWHWELAERLSHPIPDAPAGPTPKRAAPPQHAPLRAGDPGAALWGPRGRSGWTSKLSNGRPLALGTSPSSRDMIAHARRWAAGAGPGGWLAAARAAPSVAVRTRCLRRALAPRAPSPRYQVYAAAAACWFGYPQLTTEARRAAHRLPQPPPRNADGRVTAAAIAANYRRFVQHTLR